MKLLIPIDKVFITQSFGANPKAYAKYGLPGHNGVDFRTKFIDSPLGHRYVTASADGIVNIVRADAAGYGTHIRITHKDGSMTIYGHLAKSYVSKGQTVKAGQRIGLTDNTGSSTGSHLHWEFRLAGWEKKTAKEYCGAVNPLLYT
jgi:murein DD-endopeptidase MepM/ murein hydrolase activator NlpD